METGQTTHCGNKKTLIVYFFSKCYLNQKIKLMLYLRSQYNSNRSHELIRKIFIWIQKQVYFRQSFRTNRINFAAKRVALCWPLEWSQVNVLASPVTSIFYIQCVGISYQCGTYFFYMYPCHRLQKNCAHCGEKLACMLAFSLWRK